MGSAMLATPCRKGGLSSATQSASPVILFLLRRTLEVEDLLQGKKQPQLSHIDGMTEAQSTSYTRSANMQFAEYRVLGIPFRIRG